MSTTTEARLPAHLPSIEELHASLEAAEAERADLIAERTVGPIAAARAYLAKDGKFKYGAREARIAFLEEVLVGLRRIESAVMLSDLLAQLAAALADAELKAKIAFNNDWSAGGSTRTGPTLSGEDPGRIGEMALLNARRRDMANALVSSLRDRLTAFGAAHPDAQRILSQFT